jgi:hypothetical protein
VLRLFRCLQNFVSLKLFFFEIGDFLCRITSCGNLQVDTNFVEIEISSLFLKI